MESMFCGCRLARKFWSSKFDTVSQIGGGTVEFKDSNDHNGFTLHSSICLNIQSVSYLPVLFFSITLLFFFQSSPALSSAYCLHLSFLVAIVYERASDHLLDTVNDHVEGAADTSKRH